MPRKGAIDFIEGGECALRANRTGSGELSFKVIAHRGACQHAPENTAAAVRRALELGSTSVELDPQLSRDGVVIPERTITAARAATGRAAPRSAPPRSIGSRYWGVGSG